MYESRCATGMYEGLEDTVFSRDGYSTNLLDVASISDQYASQTCF